MSFISVSTQLTFQRRIEFVQPPGFYRWPSRTASGSSLAALSEFYFKVPTILPQWDDALLDFWLVQARVDSASQACLALASSQSPLYVAWPAPWTSLTWSLSLAYLPSDWWTCPESLAFVHSHDYPWWSRRQAFVAIAQCKSSFSPQRACQSFSAASSFLQAPSCWT